MGSTVSTCWHILMFENTYIASIIWKTFSRKYRIYNVKNQKYDNSCNTNTSW